jgi:hypothetical protein
MTFSDYITDHGTRINKSHFVSLIQVSQADGIVSPSERKMLHRLGTRFGLTGPEIDNMIESEKEHEFHAPYSLEEKFSQLYNVACLILADDVIAVEEKKILSRIGTEVGFDSKVIENFQDTLFAGIRNDQDEESLLDKFRKVLFRK